MYSGVFPVLCVDYMQERVNVPVCVVVLEVNSTKKVYLRLLLLVIGNTALRTKIRTGFRIHASV